MVGTSNELQEVAMASLVKYPEIFAKTLREIDETYFNNVHYRLIYRCLCKHYGQYLVLPSKKELALLLRENHTPEFGVLSDYIKVLDDLVNSDISSEDFAFDKVIEFVKRVQGERALKKVLESFDGNTIDLNSVLTSISDAMTVNVSRSAICNLADTTDIGDIRTEAFGDDNNPVIVKFFIEAVNKSMQYKGFIPGTLNVISAPPGVGKLLANDTPILTKNGWKRHGDLKVGDYVIGLDGEFKKVIHVYPKFEANRCIEFTNGEKILCHFRHEWMVDVNGHGYSVLETQDIEKKKLETGIPNKRGHRYTCLLPNKEYIKGEQKDLPVKPYTLGVWLGDGTNKHPRITSPFSDIEVIEGVKADGYKVTSMAVHKTTGVPSYYCDFRGGLNELGMCNYKFVTEKHIPSMYLTASIEQRLDLLAGLLDTDGCLVGNKYSFTTTSIRLKDTFCELISTFGWRASIRCIEPKTSTSGIVGRLPVYTVQFTPDCKIPCRLPRKQNTGILNKSIKRIAISKITEIDPVEGNCIAVDGNGMYLAGRSMLPTHNTTILLNQGLYTAQQGYKVLHIFLGDMTKFDAKTRYLSILSGIPTKKIVELSDQDLGKFIAKFNMSGILSNIDIVSYAADELTANQLIEEIKVIQTKSRKHYDCIIVDYDENIASEETDMYKSGGVIYNKMAYFSRYNKSVTFIASQPKTEYSSYEILPMECLAESSKKQKIVDTVMTIGKPSRGSEVATVHVPKNRRGTSGSIYRCHVCGETGKFEHITEEEYLKIKQQERGKGESVGE